MTCRLRTMVIPVSVVLSLMRNDVGIAQTIQLQATSKPRPPRIEGLQVEPEVFDLRYAPRRWQASICLPDDPHKSIVGSDGALYSDYGQGRFFDFKCRVSPAMRDVRDLTPVEQRLLDARVPIVITRWESGPLVLETRTWAGLEEGAAPEPGASPSKWADQRLDMILLTLSNKGEDAVRGGLALSVDPAFSLSADASGQRLVDASEPARVFATFWPRPERIVTAQAGRLRPRSPMATLHSWARPEVDCAARFRHILVGWNGPIELRFKAAERGHTYRAVFGLIEGYHPRAGVRPLLLEAEGAESLRVDPIARAGRNQPVLISLDVTDQDADGEIALAVRSPRDAADHNTILSALWIFEAGESPTREQILSGVSDGEALAVIDAETVDSLEHVEVAFGRRRLEPGESLQALVAVHRGSDARPRVRSVADGAAELERAVAYWKGLDLPYDRITIPDKGMQGLFDSCIRNIYQARELRGGRPAFQVGPTCYRGLWAADGPFILEAITYLGRAAEVRPGLELLSEGDEGPQGVAFSKKSGLRLWMILRHAQLTGDREWLQAMWPKVVAEVQRIHDLREMTRKDPQAVNYGLMPAGFGDGGLGGIHRDYTNIYWNLAGLRAALETARLLGRREALSSWQAEYDDFRQAFDAARRRDALVDEHGNTYVPVTMKGEEPQPPQRGAWAFLQSVFPGRVFSLDDPYMLGTMAMLSAVEREGVIYGTGWIPDGIWNYAASFYGHAHLWLGHGRKAAGILYAFANHACPLLCWREEQRCVGDPERYVGDMPHNWASAEFIRLVRHLLVLERGRELHLFEGLPRPWTRAGAVTRAESVPTRFGEVSFTLSVAPDGRSAHLELLAPGREPPDRLVLHLDAFGRSAGARLSGGQAVSAQGLPIEAGQPLEVEIMLGLAPRKR